MQNRFEGRIIKALAGFYYVRVSETGEVYQCRARGIFRKSGNSPLVGDKVLIQITDEKDMEGNVEEILPRTSRLQRPAVANVDLCLVVFAAAQPAPKLSVLDRILVGLAQMDVPAVICFNKTDLVSGEEKSRLAAAYAGTGYRVVWTNAKEQVWDEDFMDILHGHLAVVAGPSGAGKSTMINALANREVMETGEISKKIKRGKQTTRHTQIVHVAEHTYICDTPGFGSLDLPRIEPAGLGGLFPEFLGYEDRCRFSGCSHISEPGCGVKEALADGKISEARYESYRMFYRELSEMKTY